MIGGCNSDFVEHPFPLTGKPHKQLTVTKEFDPSEFQIIKFGRFFYYLPFECCKRSPTHINFKAQTYRVISV